MGSSSLPARVARLRQLAEEPRGVRDWNELLREVESRFRYLATQCPECGVPDEPGHGPWAS